VAYFCLKQFFGKQEGISYVSNVHTCSADFPAVNTGNGRNLDC